MKKWLVAGAIFLLLCSALVLYLTRCEVCNATNYPPEGQTIVAFGDSLVEGVGSEQGGGFVSILEDRISIPIYNLGISGNTTAQGLARIEDVVALNPDITIVVLGGNDILKKIPEAETFDNLRTIVTSLQQAGSVVILAGVRTGIFSKRYNDSYKALANDTNTIYLEDILGGLVGRTELMADPIHPNDNGYTRIADRFEPILLQLVDR